MSKTKVTSEQASHKPKKHGCCFGGALMSLYIVYVVFRAATPEQEQAA